MDGTAHMANISMVGELLGPREEAIIIILPKGNSIKLPSKFFSFHPYSSAALRPHCEVCLCTGW